MSRTITPTVDEASIKSLSALMESLPSKASLEPMRAADVAREQAALYALLGYIDDVKKRANELYDSCRFSILPRAMETEGLEGLKVEGVGRVSLTSDMRVSIPAERRNEAYEWLTTEGSGDLITETVNAQTLAAFVKQRLRAGKDVPAELFKQSPFTRATISKG